MIAEVSEVEKSEKSPQAERRYYVDYEVPKPGVNAGMTLYTIGPTNLKRAKMIAQATAEEERVYAVRLRTMVLVETLESVEHFK